MEDGSLFSFVLVGFIAGLIVHLIFDTFWASIPAFVVGFLAVAWYTLAND